jgi:hypothetical protein
MCAEMAAADLQEAQQTTQLSQQGFKKPMTRE